MTEPDREPTMYEWCGGLPALIRMARLFYGKHAPADPLLAPIFASMSADHPERVAKWLAEVFGGPRFYSREYGGYPRMVSQHLGRSLTEEWRARWVGLMAQSATEAGLPNDAEFRSAFVAYLEWGSHIAVENSQPNAQPPQRMPMPRWDWGTAGPPGTRISPPAQPTQEESAVLPALDEAVLFHQHVKPLFRTHDRRSMKFAFDLWSYDDVKAHAAAILHQISAGTMPCDRAWPAERVAVLRRWIDTGMPQ